MRTRSFAKCQIVAIVAGLGLGLVFAFLVVGGLPPHVVFIDFRFGLPLYAVPTIIGILVLRWLAGWLGRYEKFTFLTAFIALAVSFGLAYAHSVMAWITDRGEIHGTIIGGGPPPEEYAGHFIVLASLALWIALMLGIALKWKHLLAGSPEPLAEDESSRLSFWVRADSILVTTATVVLLGLLLAHRREWSSPPNVLARASATLADKNSPVGARALAVYTIGNSHSPGAVEALRREVREDKGPNQISAAIRLLGRDDLLALSVLEQPLLHGEELPALRSDNFSYPGGKYGMAVEYVRDPAAIPTLVQLMAAPEADTRRGAASALRTILELKQDGIDSWKPAWPDTVDQPSVKAALVKALDDPDNLVRYFAVGALMEACGNPHYPSRGKFEREEQAYLDEWKKRGSESQNSP